MLGSGQSLVLSKRVVKSVAESGESIVSNGRKIKLVSILFADELLTEIFGQLNDTSPEDVPESIALAFPPSPLRGRLDRSYGATFCKTCVLVWRRGVGPVPLGTAHIASTLSQCTALTPPAVVRIVRSEWPLR